MHTYCTVYTILPYPLEPMHTGDDQSSTRATARLHKYLALYGWDAQQQRVAFPQGPPTDLATDGRSSISPARARGRVPGPGSVAAAGTGLPDQVCPGSATSSEDVPDR